MNSDPELFIAPCSREHKEHTFRHFQDTVLHGVSVEDYDLSIGADSGRVSVWGAVSGNEDSWERLDQGDVVLFYTMSGIYTHAARVQATEKNPGLSDRIWEIYDGNRLVRDLDEPWPHLIYFYNVERVDIPVGDLHPTIGWDSEYPLGFTRIGDDGQTRIRREYGGVPALMQAYANGEGRNIPEEIEERKQEFLSAVHTSPTLTIDRFALSDTEIAVRDFAFRKAIADLYGHACAVCGAVRQAPHVGYEIHPTRIYPKTERGNDDVRNGIALCAHHLWAFRTGWFGLNSANEIIVNSVPDRSGFEEIERLAGRQIRIPDHSNAAPHELFTRAHRKLHDI